MTVAVAEVVARTKQMTIAEQCDVLRAVAEMVSAEVRQAESPPRRSYRRWIAAAGSMHSDHRDVSSSVDAHLGEIYADQHRTK